MHDIINSNSPLNITHLFTEISDVHNYNILGLRLVKIYINLNQD